MKPKKDDLEIVTHPPTMKWAAMDTTQKKRYVFRVLVMLCTAGYVFPNAIVE